jgi:hypothetical protein
MKEGLFPVSLQEKTALQGLLWSLKPILNIGHHTSFATVLTFLFVALDEGKCGSAYARNMGIGRATALRRLHLLGDHKRDGTPGVGLVTFKPDNKNNQQRVFLSAKGRRLASEIFAHLPGASMKDWAA